MRGALPKRRSVRLAGFDYGGGYTWFVTICTHERACLFGEINDVEMQLNQYGGIAHEEWSRSQEIRRELIPHAFIVMPNHVHLLFSLNPDALDESRHPVGAHCNAPAPPPDLSDAVREFRRTPHSVSTIVGGYKGAVTRRMRTVAHDNHWEIWQRNYHEHVVRNERDFQMIAAYIETNPANWHKDRFYS